MSGNGQVLIPGLDHSLYGDGQWKPDDRWQAEEGFRDGKKAINRSRRSRGKMQVDDTQTPFW